MQNIRKSRNYIRTLISLKTMRQKKNPNKMTNQFNGQEHDL